jgi:hypothetical protein
MRAWARGSRMQRGAGDAFLWLFVFLSAHLPIAGSFKVATDVVDLGFGNFIVDLRLWRPPG